MCFKRLIYVLVYCFLYLHVESFIDIAFPCFTPNGEEAYCVSIFSCPTLMKALGSLDRSSVEFVKRSVCCGCTPGDMKVCCGTKSNFIDRSKPKNATIQHVLTSPKPPKSSGATNQHPITSPKPPMTTSRTKQVTKTQLPVSTRKQKLDLLPARSYCGLQHTDDRPYQDNATALDEFPWLVNIIVIDEADEEPDQFLNRCNGVLINNRYVLTNDDCATDALLVRLGQYNTDKNVSCTDNPDTPECSEPWLNIGVEKEIHRVDFNQYLPQLVAGYDFGLVRLNQSVPFSDFIRPICLPLDETTKPSQDEGFYFSGWGASNANMIEKKRLIYNLTSVEDCYKLDKKLKADSENISLMCLKPELKNGDVSCQGDEAGPLMYPHRHQWFVEGLVMKVYHDGGDSDARCSNTHPLIAARITSEVIDWILDTIKQ